MKKTNAFIIVALLSGSVFAHESSLNDIRDDISKTNDRIDSVQDSISGTNKVLTGVQDTLYSEGLLRAEGDRIVASNAQKKLDAESSKLQESIGSNSSKINDLTSAFQSQAANTTAEISRLDGRIDSVEKKTEKLKAGVASATAIATLTQYTGSGTHHIAVGVGGYDGASALAGGYTYAVSYNTTIRTTVALDSEKELAFGASVGHSW
ncbi:MAG: YadA-like family protein [Clostridium sp.]